MPTFFSPAKINLTLQVKFRREDGFHEIESLFHALSFGDYLTLDPADRDSFTTNSATLPLDQTNLVMRALSLFRKKTGLEHPVKVHLEKNIPTQSGLGGGSSNAATTLFALKELFAPDLSEEKLLQWGGELGSDVPFFFSLGCATCKGRGEIVSPSNFSIDEALTLALPHLSLSTPEVYQRYSQLAIDQKVGTLFNDLEEAAFSIKPELKLFKQKLLSIGFSHVQMTGSGSAFFCLGKAQSLSPNNLTQKSPLLLPTSFLLREKNQWYLSPKDSKLYQ